MRNAKCLCLLLAIYFVAALATFFSWRTKNIYNTTGDEPHFLVIASGLVKHWSFEQTLPYAEEAKSNEIYKCGPLDQHTVHGPNGLYNKHGIGLPILLAVPFALFGLLGAKLFMIVVGAGVVAVSCAISGFFSSNQTVRFFSVLAACIGMPLIPASSQIYTDIPAGLISLSGIYFFLTLESRNRLLSYILVGAALAILPWLHMRYAAASVILTIAIIWKISRNRNESLKIRATVLIIAFSAISFLGLVAYNLYAFGNATGPFNGELEISKTSLMVLFGLFVDQNQGFLLQNPIALFGILFAGSLFALDRKLSAVWLLVFLSLIVPNSLEKSTYGGWSFAGRFQWAASIVFLLPTIFGLVRMSSNNLKVFYSVASIGIFTQALYFCLYAFNGVSIYNRPASTFFHDYTIFHTRIYSWLPVLYNVDIAYKYLPNLGWLIALCALTGAGFLYSKQLLFASTKFLVALGAFCFVVIFVSASIFNVYGYRLLFPIRYLAKDLPSNSGRVEGTARIAVEGNDKPGLVNFGPYIPLRAGSYLVIVHYCSLATVEKEVGTFEIATRAGSSISDAVALHGTGGSVDSASMVFQVAKRRIPQKYEFRSQWNGSSDLRVLDVQLECL
jgi:hypothetical protein